MGSAVTPISGQARGGGVRARSLNIDLRVPRGVTTTTGARQRVVYESAHAFLRSCNDASRFRVHCDCASCVSHRTTQHASSSRKLSPTHHPFITSQKLEHHHLRSRSKPHSQNKRTSERARSPASRRWHDHCVKVRRYVQNFVSESCLSHPTTLTRTVIS